MTAIFRPTVAAAAFAILFCGSAAAKTDRPACPEHFQDGRAPVLVEPKLTPRTRTLCYSGYAVLFSGLTRTPLWSAEHLTAQRVGEARGQDRVNAFHPDPNLPAEERSELSDYARSGYDRGHMAPSGDMPDAQSQEESFSLANMIPQDAENNRHLWAKIESGVRDLAAEAGDVYVVTGPVFAGENVQSLKGRVLVPTQIYKAVYIPKRASAAAYLAENGPGQEVRVLSLSKLRLLTGLDPFPALSQEIKDRAATLPMPTPSRRRPDTVANRPSAEYDPPTTGGLVEDMLRDIDRLRTRP
jgi:endonuclease G